MSQQLFRVFVYGTLLTAESNHYVAKLHIWQIRQGKVRGLLYNVGEYPALILDNAGETLD